MQQDSDFEQNERPAPSPPRGISTCLVVALLGVALIAVIVGIVVIAGGDRALRALEILRGEPEVVTIQVSPGEVLPVLKLAVEELHTTVHTTRTGPVLGGAMQSLPRHILAQGSVTACFDLESDASEFQIEQDVEDPQHITVRLPLPEYCFVGIDNAEFFDEAGLALPAGNEVNGLLLEDAKKQLYTAADSQDLLARAKERGAAQVEILMYKLGFKRVDIQFTEPSPVE